MNQEKIKSFFAKDRYAALTGAVIEEVGEGMAVCSLEVRPDHINAGGVVQGGAIFTLADFAFAVACNAKAVEAGEDSITVNQSASISFLNAPKGRRLIVRATRISGGHSISVYRMTVTDDLGTPIAEMTGNGFTKRKKP